MIPFNEIHRDYDFFKDVRDGLGRHWCLAAVPKHGGSFCYFHDISAMRRWLKQVEETRQMARGEKTTTDRLVESLNATCYPEEKRTIQKLLEKWLA